MRKWFLPHSEAGASNNWQTGAGGIGQVIDRFPGGF